MKSSMVFFALSMGMANPRPTLPPLGAAIQVFTPITRPRMSTSAPPELPWLMAASVWM